MKIVIRNLVIIICLFIVNSCEKDDSSNGSVTDIDGNTYRTIKVEGRWWMAENLKTTKYANGDLIGTTSPFNKDITLETNPKYQWAYNDGESYATTYGRLYTWYAVTDSRNVCPTSWHVPTDAEWTTLTFYSGREAGGNLKEKGSAHWISPNSGATNKIGFTALPGGCRVSYGTFYDIFYLGCWWSSTESSATGANSRSMYYNSSFVERSFGSKVNGLSVRCLKDN